MPSEITVDPSRIDRVEGQLNQGDEDLFRATIAGLHNLSTVVALNSPGGDLRAGHRDNRSDARLRHGRAGRVRVRVRVWAHMARPHATDGTV